MTLTPDEADYIANNSFLFGWETSWKGNMTRRWQGKVLTIFEQHPGWWSWCINYGGKKVRYSNRLYKSEGKAKKALQEELGAS